MEFFEQTGKMALGSRLRLLASHITEDAAAIYKLYDVSFSPKWFPVFFVLAGEGSRTITEIALEIGHSQPSVTKIIKELTAAGLVSNNPEPADKRRNISVLTKKGKELAVKMKVPYADVEQAIEDIMAEARHNLWEALAEWEQLLTAKSLLKRVQEQKKQRESKEVIIVPYGSQYREAFRSLNEEWISRYFEMEEADYLALNNPEEYIINKGGYILVALYRGQPVGVCALIKMNSPCYDFEMAKMAVSPAAQGKNIGWLLGQSIIDTARKLGASTLYLESNTVLKPAINLYYKMGFKKVEGLPTPYRRCNIQMELAL